MARRVKQRRKPLVTITVTLFRSGQDLRGMLPRLEAFARKHAEAFDLECIFVSDRSPDDAEAYLRAELPKITAFRSELHVLSRNFGATFALRCALTRGKGDYFAPIPPDLQDPPELIVEAIERLKTSGAHICLGIPSKRNDTFVSTWLSKTYWKLYRLCFGPEFPRAGVGFFLIDRKARNVLLGLRENTSFLFGMIFWMGLTKTSFEYEKAPREHGKSSWSLLKKLNYFLDSIFPFTVLPIRLMTLLGVGLLVVAGSYSSLTLLYAILGKVQVPGFTSLFLSISFFGALNLIGLGVLGEYIARILLNVQRRPNFIVEKSYRFADRNPDRRAKRLKRAA